MSKKRKVEEDDDELERDRDDSQQCTTLDHLWPLNPGPETRCFCGKKMWRPFIKLDDVLQVGQYIRTYEKGLIYQVEMVNESRARCRLVPKQLLLKRRADDQLDPNAGETDDESRGHVINISPRSAVARVTLEELQAEIETPTRRIDTMANKFAGTPVAGKSVKERNAERLAKLNKKPASTARPLTGAAAKAKANAKPKPQKTVRECGCGCGGETMSYFVPGHDARYKGWMKKLASGDLDQAGLRKLMGQKLFGKYSFKKTSAGFAPKESYQEVAEA